MESVKDSLKRVLHELLAEGREKAAAPLSPEKLRDTLLAMARKGVAEFRVSPTFAVDIRKTRIAKAGCAFLDKEGIAHDWQAAVAMPDSVSNPGGLSGEYYELVVRLKL